MSKWVSYGWLADRSPEAKRAQEIEEELLREYLPVILANSGRILQTARYFYCQLASSWLSSPWVYGGGPIPLGVLVLLWESGEMRFECPSCGGDLYAIGVAGSVLSGSGSAWGICIDCRTSQRSNERIPEAIHAVGPLLSRYQNLPIVQKGKRPVFDWKDGLKGEFTPDKVLVPDVEPVDLWELLCELTGRETGEYERTPAQPGTGPHGLRSPILLEKRRK